MRRTVLPEGVFWEMCKACTLPVIVSQSTSVNGGTVSHGCPRCILRVAEERGVRDAITEGMRALPNGSETQK